MAYRTTMKRDDVPRSGMFLGGIGTGGFEIRKDAQVYNWQMMNNFPLGSGNPCDMFPEANLYFTVRWQEEGKFPGLRILQIDKKKCAGSINEGELYYMYHWMKGMEVVEYEASFPYLTITYRDVEMPFDIRMKAFSPFIPHDVKNSSLPVVNFDFEIIPKKDRKYSVMLMATVRNTVGYDVEDKYYVANVIDGKAYRSFRVTCEGMDKTWSSYGTFSMASNDKDATYYLGWEHMHPYTEVVRDNTKLPNIDDTDNRNMKDEDGKLKAMPRHFSTLATSFDMVDEPVKRKFVLSWDFPNAYGQKPTKTQFCTDGPFFSDVLEGHYHNNFFQGSDSVIKYFFDNYEMLHSMTNLFHSSFFDSSLPEYVLDQINSHLNTLVSSGVLNIDGEFGVEEGRSDNYFGGVNTIDVTNYSQVMFEALFPELAKTILRISARQQTEDGYISHHQKKAFKSIEKFVIDTPRRDLPIQFSVMALRSYFWTNDRAYLEEMWPYIRKALKFSLSYDKDGDGIPDMEGIMCSYDNFPMYGTSAFIGSQWLCCMTYCIEAAKVLGDEVALAEYSDSYEKAIKSFEERLWNGRYYRLCNDEGGKTGIVDEGCLVDQVVGQWAGFSTNAGYFFNPDHYRKALKNIMANSYQPQYGLLNCRWPGQEFINPLPDDIWVDQGNTCWTGVELEFAGALMYEGMYYEALEIIKNVNDRYTNNGMYFDHIECGGHYNRPLSSWNILNGAAGFSACNEKYRFAPRVPKDYLRLFVLSSDAALKYYHSVADQEIKIDVAYGEWKVKELTLDSEYIKPTDVCVTVDGKCVSELGCTVFGTEEGIKLVFNEPYIIKESLRCCVNA